MFLSSIDVVRSYAYGVALSSLVWTAEPRLHDLFAKRTFRGEKGKKNGTGKTPSPATIEPSMGFLSRKESFLPLCAIQDGFFNSICRVALGQTTYDEASIDEVLTQVNNRVGTTLDFRVNSLLRMLYLDQETQSLPTELKRRIKETVLGFRYWFTDPPTVPDFMIFWTENHRILYLTCELLAGQMFPNEIFPVSGLTGAQHVDRVLPVLNDWLDQKGRLGFAEWHSNPYMHIEISALVNLVDFSVRHEISTKAAMLLDLIGFDLANHYFRGLYATSMGRTEDRRRVTTTPRLSESMTNSAHLILGLAEMFLPGQTDMGSIAIATSRNYVPPPILEKIALAARDCHEHYERKSIQVDQGDLFGFGYDPIDINDIMFWWSMSAPLAGPVVEATITLIDQFSLNPTLIVNDAQFLDVLQLGAATNAVSLSDYCSTTAAYLVRGPALETANIYTYRTPHYQLSGAQDHSKGWTSLQKHAWQATLDTSTYVFTNSPSQLSEEFIGGWMPRATLFKNVGVIQYDKDPGDPFLNAVLESVGGVKDYLHAYFPRSQFDEWREVESMDGTYLFGRKGTGYVSLYSKIGGAWRSDFEWLVSEQKNVFVLELGSAMENGSFAQFQRDILSASLLIGALPDRGYSVSYESPSVGLVEVAWEGAMTVEGYEVDLGPYPRYNNAFCHQEFASPVTEIQYLDELLRLDFTAGERSYFKDEGNTEKSKDESSDEDSEDESSDEDNEDESSDEDT